MEIVKIPWIFTSAKARGEVGLMSKCAAAAKTNTWQICGRQLQMVTVTDEAISIGSR